MKRIRSGAGLGDSLYLRPIVEHFVRAGERLLVLTDYPEIFEGVESIQTDAYKRVTTDIIAHYALYKNDETTTQYADMLRSAGIAGDVPLRFDWAVRNRRLIDELRREANGRPLIVVHGGRVPFGRTDGYGAELTPQRRGFDAVSDALRDCYLVGIGGCEQIYPLAVSRNLNGGTTVRDLLDIGCSCDGIVAQCSFAVPLAEVFDKPLLAVWSARGLASSTRFVNAITPRKILSKPRSGFVVDDWPVEKIWESARAFRQF